MIACKTLIGKGGGPKEGDPHSHGYTLFDDEIAATREAMGWDRTSPFEMPDDHRDRPGIERRPRGSLKDVRKAWEGQASRRRAKAADFTLRHEAATLPEFAAFAALDANIDELPRPSPAEQRHAPVHSGAALDEFCSRPSPKWSAARPT